MPVIEKAIERFRYFIEDENPSYILLSYPSNMQRGPEFPSD